MSCDEWVHGPIGADAERWSTGNGKRIVLVVVHSITAATRLADIIPLLESDLRIQVVFTRAVSSFPGGVTDYLNRLGAAYAPWSQAIRERFDLALAASYGKLEQLRAPVLTVSHGIGYGKYPDRMAGFGPPAERSAWGLERQQLIYHGRVVPATIALPHRDWLPQLERSCPEAMPAAVVAGDPTYDRLVASLALRARYRRALGVGNDQKLVVVSSTWGPRSLLGTHPDVVPRLVSELPRDEYRIAVIAHPNIWQWHGHWQVRAWYAECIRAGVALLPPEEGWRAALVAGDRLLGDHGSVTYYGAAIGLPTLLGTYPDDAIDPGSQVALLGRTAPRAHWSTPLLPQLEDTASAYSPELHAILTDRVTSVPGESGRILRREMYRLMQLTEPPSPPPRPEPVTPPCPVTLPMTPGTI
jgi:hypothetical protein